MVAIVVLLDLGNVLHPLISTSAPTCVGGGSCRSILYDACDVHVGENLTLQDARPVKGRADGRSDTLIFMTLPVHSNGHRRDP